MHSSREARTAMAAGRRKTMNAVIYKNAEAAEGYFNTSAEAENQIVPFFNSILVDIGLMPAKTEITTINTSPEGHSFWKGGILIMERIMSRWSIQEHKDYTDGPDTPMQYMLRVSEPELENGWKLRRYAEVYDGLAQRVVSTQEKGFLHQEEVMVKKIGGKIVLAYFTTDDYEVPVIEIWVPAEGRVVYAYGFKKITKKGLKKALSFAAKRFDDDDGNGSGGYDEVFNARDHIPGIRKVTSFIRHGHFSRLGKAPCEWGSFWNRVRALRSVYNAPSWCYAHIDGDGNLQANVPGLPVFAQLA